MDIRKLKKALEDLQKHVQILGFNLHQIKTDDKNRLETCKIAVRYLEDLLSGEFKDLDNRLSENISKSVEKKHIASVKKITKANRAGEKRISSLIQAKGALLSNAISSGQKEKRKNEKEEAPKGESVRG